MNQKLHHEEVNMATNGSKKRSKAGHWARMAVCICTGGFGFPHAFTEGDAETRQGSEKTRK
jgi:hypothetical protein